MRIDRLFNFVKASPSGRRQSKPFSAQTYMLIIVRKEIVGRRVRLPCQSTNSLFDVPTAFLPHGEAPRRRHRAEDITTILPRGSVVLQ